MKKKKKRSAGGNYGKPSLKNGVKSLEIPLQSVLRLREFDIENKK